MSLLPSSGPDASPSQDGEYEVVGVDEDVDAVIDALASDTARTVLNAIYEEPGTPSELADRLDMSIQKVSYHLDKLEAEDLIAVAGTRYSEKGQEMTVYEPPDDPLVLFVGTRDRKETLRTLLKRLVPAGLLLALASLVVQRLFAPSGSEGAEPMSAQTDGGDAAGGGGADGGGGGADGGGDAGTADATPTPSVEALDTPVPEATEAAAEAAGSGLSTGVAFFLGGLLVIALVAGWWAWREFGR